MSLALQFLDQKSAAICEIWDVFSCLPAFLSGFSSSVLISAIRGQNLLCLRASAGDESLAASESARPRHPSGGATGLVPLKSPVDPNSPGLRCVLCAFCSETTGLRRDTCLQFDGFFSA